MPIQVGAYIRLSRKDGDKSESDSVVNQKELLDMFIIRNKGEFVLYDRYIDDDYTGTNFDRPSFKRMMDDIKNNKITCVLVKDLSRFGRDYIDVGNYLQKVFPKMGVRFIAVNDHIDSGKQAYDMLMPVKNIFNEQYARDISQKVLSAINTRQSNGQFIGAFACYGYLKDSVNKNHLVVDQYAANIVQRIYKLFISGCGKMSIAKILNNENILCPSEYKKLQNSNYSNSNKLDSTSYWTYSTINVILNNEIYIGNMIQHKNNFSRYRCVETRLVPSKDWIVVENTHDPIIDKTTWDTAQSLLNKRTREIKFDSNNSIFAGFLRCGDCGRAMSKIATRGRTRFVCGTYKRYSKEICTEHRIFEEDLNNLILGMINGELAKAKYILQYAEEQEKLNDTQDDNKKIAQALTKLELQKNKTVLLKKGLYEDYKAGILTQQEYSQYKEEYQKQENNLSEQIRTLQDSSTQNKEIFENPWVKLYKEFNMLTELTRPILALFIKSIVVYENSKIDVTYNFTEISIPQ